MQHEPSVLRQHSSVVEFQLGIVAANADEPLGRVGGQRDAMAFLDGQRINETVCAAVVVGLEPLKLPRFLAVGAGNGLTGGITGQTAQAPVDCVSLQPILRRQELQVEAGVSGQFLRHGLVEPDDNLHRLSLGSNHHPTVEVVVVIAHVHFDGAVFAVNLPAGHLGHKVPLFGSLVQPDGTALNGAHPMMDDFYARVLLVVETAVETITEHKYVHALPLEIFTVVELKVLRLTKGSCRYHQAR